MWHRTKLIVSNKELMFRILFTVLMLLLFRILIVVKIPMFDASQLQLFLKSSDFLTLLNSFGGQALEKSSIVALGISPYITASIVVQLLQMVVPQLKEWREQGEAGKQKTSKITRYVAVVLAFAQGLLLVYGAGGNGQNIVVVGEMNYTFIYIFMAIVLTAGSALTIWIADLITKKGIGNGTSILIVAGIVTSLPNMGTSLWKQFITDGSGGWDIFKFIIIVLIYLLTILLVTFMQISQRKIPVQYANRQGKSDSNIPLKLNSAGVMPVIFASTIMSIPLTIVGLLSQSGTSGASYWLDQIFNNQKPIGLLVYIILIVIFSFFYSFLTVEPNKIAENLSKGNAYIPGVRPGEDTKNYVARLLFKITLIGTVYLVFVAVLPLVVNIAFGLGSSIAIGGTSLLIVVGVAIETTEQIETDANKSEYTGIF